MEDQHPPSTPTSARFRSTSSETPKTPLRPSPTPYQPKYSHPYGIKSTSSGVLSSAAVSSSPNNAISAHSYQQHKSSKSMHSLLRNSSSIDDLAGSAAASPGSPGSPAYSRQDLRHGANLNGFKYDSIGTRKRTLAQRASMSDLATIARDSPGGKDLESLASPRKRVTELREEWMKGEMSRGEGAGLARAKVFEERWNRELDKLPKNPKHWTTAELATFVSRTLMQDSIETEKPPTTPGQDVPAKSLVTSTKGNRNGHHALPPSVIEEIRTWIYRQRLDGKAFIRGGEGDWAVSEESPPFLPILLSLSRHLRRASLKSGTSFGKPSISLNSDQDPFMQHPDTAHSWHIRDSSVLQETDENEDPQDVTLGFLEGDDEFSHVREVVDRIDRRLFDDLHPSHLIGNQEDIFQQTRQSRTMSLSSSHSAASLLSSDTNDSVCVSERAALFESGVLGRQANRTAEEREGRVLGKGSSDEVGLVRHSESSPHAGEDDAAFDATIKASTFGPLAVSELANDASSRPPMRPAHEETVTARISLDAKDLPAIPAHILPLVAYGVSLATCTPLSSGSAYAGSSNPEKDPVSMQCSDEEANPVPSHMSRMAAHEKAGRRPYGALRRAHSTPVPRFREDQQLDSDKDERDPGKGSLTMLALAGIGPRNQQTITFAIQDNFDPSSSGAQDRRVTARPLQREKHEAPRLLSFDSLNSLTKERPGIPPWTQPLVGHDLLRETEERLAFAQARISALEQALAEVVEEKMVLQKRLDTAEERSRMAKDLDKTNGPDIPRVGSADSHNGASVTILWRWLTNGQTVSSPTNVFGPPQSLGQLPGYVFLVGVGLSVIVARVVLSRPLSRGR